MSKIRKSAKTIFDPKSRIGIHQVALIFLNDFGWIEREQPISDFGIDLHIEIVMNGKPTGQLFAVQVKTGRRYFERGKGKYVIFDKAEQRHLEYWVDHSVPVILVLVDPTPDQEIILWEHISWKNIKETNKNWTISIDKKNILQSARDKIIDIYLNQDKFCLLSEEDASTDSIRRIEARYRVDGQVQQTRFVMRNMIPRLIECQKQNQLYRDQSIWESWKDKEHADTVVIYFFRNKRESDAGLNFCIAVWNDPSMPVENQFLPPDHSEIVNDIRIYYWYNQVYDWDELWKNHRTNTVEFLKLFDAAARELDEIYEKIQEALELLNNDSELVNFRLTLAELGIDSILHRILQIGDPPEEIDDLLKSLKLAALAFRFINNHIVNGRNPVSPTSFLISCIKTELNKFVNKREFYSNRRSSIPRISYGSLRE